MRQLYGTIIWDNYMWPPKVEIKFFYQWRKIWRFPPIIFFAVVAIIFGIELVIGVHFHLHPNNHIGDLPPWFYHLPNNYIGFPAQQSYWGQIIICNMIHKNGIRDSCPVHCCPLLSIVINCCPLLSIVVYRCPLLSSHWTPLDSSGWIYMEISVRPYHKSTALRC